MTRRSVTRILVLLNNTPISAYCKRQRTVETSTYGSEMVAAQIAVEIILEIRYALRMLGVPIERTSLLMEDNNSLLLNTTLPSSMLKKKHLGCSYHQIREAVLQELLILLTYLVSRAMQIFLPSHYLSRLTTSLQNHGCSGEPRS